MGFGRFIFPDIINNEVVFSGDGLKKIDKKMVVCDVVWAEMVVKKFW